MIQIALKLCCCCLLILPQFLDAQSGYDLHWISFKDKKGTPYSVFHPEEFLSARAIERRVRQGITIDSSDLPITPAYIAAVRQKGFRVHLQSKWLNGIAVVGAEEDIQALSKLPFVRHIRPIGFLRKAQYPKTGVGARDYKTSYPKNKNYYGAGQNQIYMLNGQYLHAMGYRGQGMPVAVMDGGFNYMPETPTFDSAFAKRQIIETHDFLEGDDFVFESSEHGTDVLSTMVSNLPYLFVGTAPEANYFLYKTEDELGEYVQEEYTWIASIEYADSIGVFVVNTSLGYYNYDDNAMDYTYDQLNGKFAPMSIASQKAIDKGILLVTSAGNEGDGDWKHITVPADVPQILTVGAVDRDGFKANFSSTGFSNRSYIKPDVVARGHSAVVGYRGRYDTRYQFGTSFSSPIMAGMATVLWQACPYVRAQEVVQTLQRTANQFERPDTMLGYGVPDFLKAYNELSSTVIHIKEPSKTEYRHYGSGNQEFVDVFVQRAPNNMLSIQLVDNQGNIIRQTQATATINDLFYHRLSLQGLPHGTYRAYLRWGCVTHHLLLAK